MEPITQNSEKPSMPLSPEALGWKLEHDWPGLFTLFTKGEKTMVIESSELWEIREALLKGHTKNDEKALKLDFLLSQLAYLPLDLPVEQGIHEASKMQAFKSLLFRGLQESLGEPLHRLLTAETKGKTETAATDAVALFKRAVSGMVHGRYPEKARGSGDKLPKEIRAIDAARNFCEMFRRLPKKSEVRNMMESCGIRYKNDKSRAKSKWESLFDLAGLASLPD